MYRECPHKYMNTGIYVWSVYICMEYILYICCTCTNKDTRNKINKYLECSQSEIYLSFYDLLVQALGRYHWGFEVSSVSKYLYIKKHTKKTHQTKIYCKQTQNMLLFNPATTVSLGGWGKANIFFIFIVDTSNTCGIIIIIHLLTWCLCFSHSLISLQIPAEQMVFY